MKSKLSILLCAACLVASDGAMAETKPKDKAQSISLSEAVYDLNARALKDDVGKTQELLTTDEVIAAIRLWDREQWKIDDPTYAMFQDVAKSRKLPAGSKFDFITRCNQCNGFNVEVWWVDLGVGDKKYRYRIRDRKLRCVTDGPNEDRLELKKNTKN
jgi:hypothetical protein